MPKRSPALNLGTIGQRGELLVAEMLMKHGWFVAQPMSSSSVFDLLAGKGGKTWRRLQVKTTLEKHKYSQCSEHYQFQLSHGMTSKKRYTAAQVDFFVCCALDSKRFWVLPFAQATTTCLKIYNGKDSRLHKYEDAWDLLD